MTTLNRGKTNSAALEDADQLFLDTEYAGTTQDMAETADTKNIQMKTQNTN